MQPLFLRRPKWAIASLIALAAASAYAVTHLRAAGDAHAVAQANQVEVERLIEEVQELRRLPQFAALESVTAESLSLRVDDAATEVGLSASAVVRIQPQAAIWMDDAPYRVWPTRVELTGVTVRELVEFTDQLIDEASGFTVRDLRIWTSGRESTGRNERWSAEIILTQITFSPKTRRP